MQFAYELTIPLSRKCTELMEIRFRFESLFKKQIQWDCKYHKFLIHNIYENLENSKSKHGTTALSDVTKQNYHAVNKQ